MRSWKPRMVALLSCVLAGWAGGAPVADAAPRWRPCPELDGATCTTVTVPLDRTGTLPGEVGLRVAQVTEGERGTLVYLSGGPGSAGIGELAGLMPMVDEALREFRVLGFDQRGTGRSGLLRCPELEGDGHLRAGAAGAACAGRLGPARTRYTTADSVADLEAIRVAAGAERLTLLGISYGTELALAYARAHPERVERLILDSVVDPDDEDPFALASWDAIVPALSRACPDGCRAVSRDPGKDLRRLADRLRERPLTGVVIDARGRASRRTLTAQDLADVLFSADYLPELRAGFSAGVAAALHHDDVAPLLRLVAAAAPLDELPSPAEFSSARYATVCEDAPLPWDPGTPVVERSGVAGRRAAALAPGAFGPFTFAEGRADVIDLCSRWPSSPAAGSPPAPRPVPRPYPRVRTLILQGGEDLRTPPAVSARVAEALPGAERVLLPGVGHAPLAVDPSGCAMRQLGRFLRDAAVSATCPAVPSQVRSVPVAPPSLAAVTPAPGTRGRAGRTLAAVSLTLADVAYAAGPGLAWQARGGGLRGGTYAVSRRLVLRRVSYVPGVEVDGRGDAHGLSLRVSGSAATSGRLRLERDGRLVGRLGGRAVAVRVDAAARLAGVPRARTSTLRTR